MQPLRLQIVQALIRRSLRFRVDPCLQLVESQLALLERNEELLVSLGQQPLQVRNVRVLQLVLLHYEPLNHFLQDRPFLHILHILYEGHFVHGISAEKILNLWLLLSVERLLRFSFSVQLPLLLKHCL